MSKRNLILIIVLIVIVLMVVASVFLPSLKTKNNSTNNTSGSNFLSEFFPFAQNKISPSTEEGTPPIDISDYVSPTSSEISKERLKKVSSMSIAGYGVFLKERFKEEVPVILENLPASESNEVPATEIKNSTAPLTEFVPALRYVERTTGNIYQTFADRIDERKFTTTIVPVVQEAFFGEKAESVVMRYLKTDEKTIESFAGTLPKEVLGGDTTETNEIKGSFLPENITDISLSPNNSSMFYLFNTENGSIGITSSPSGEKKNQIFNSPFTEWLSWWPNNRMITLTTKPSFGVPGLMYSFDPNIKKMSKILSEINGLTTLTSPSGKLILYSNNTLALRIYNTDMKDSFSIGVKTMPEKCVWNKDSTILYCAVPRYITGTRYPDLWYQGEISFADDLWKIDVANNTTTNLVDSTSFKGGEEVDGIKLSLDENEDYLFFVNKKDSYLWGLRLK